MYKSKLRNKNKTMNKNIENNNNQQQIEKPLLSMDKLKSPVHKRLREINNINIAENTPKLCSGFDRESLNLNNTNSPLRLIQIMDKRFEKLSDQLQTTMKAMFREYEERLLSEIDKSLTITKNELINVTKRVVQLESEVQFIKNTASVKITQLENENKKMKNEIEKFKKYVKVKENTMVSHDLRINGVPHSDNEKLDDVYRRICDTVGINPPITQNIFRVKIGKNNGDINMLKDAPIIIKFTSPYDRNYVLKSIRKYIKEKKEPFRLNIIGFNSATPFFINENLTPENHKIFARAHRMKKNRMIAAAFVQRGIVYIRAFGDEEPLRIDEYDGLNQFFRPNDDASNR